MVGKPATDGIRMLVKCFAQKEKLLGKDLEIMDCLLVEKGGRRTAHQNPCHRVQVQFAFGTLLFICFPPM